MGYINQALVQDRLFLGVERVPVVLLLMACAMGIVIDGDIEFAEVLVAVTVFGFGFWCLRICADYDPRFFKNLMVKLIAYAGFWAARGGPGSNRWMVPAAPAYLKRRPGRLRGYQSKRERRK